MDALFEECMPKQSKLKPSSHCQSTDPTAPWSMIWNKISALPWSYSILEKKSSLEQRTFSSPRVFSAMCMVWNGKFMVQLYNKGRFLVSLDISPCHPDACQYYFILPKRCADGTLCGLSNAETTLGLRYPHDVSHQSVFQLNIMADAGWRSRSVSNAQALSYTYQSDFQLAKTRPEYQVYLGSS